MFDQYGNKASMFETVNEVDKETVTKENNILLTRKPTPSQLSGNVHYLYEIYTQLIIEADVTENKNHRKIEI